MTTWQHLSNFCIFMSQHCHLPFLAPACLIMRGCEEESVYVSLPSIERGAVWDHVYTQGPTVTRELDCPRKTTAKKYTNRGHEILKTQIQ